MVLCRLLFIGVYMHSEYYSCYWLLLDVVYFATGPVFRLHDTASHKTRSKSSPRQPFQVCSRTFIIWFQTFAQRYCMMFFIVVGIWSCSQSIVVTNMLDGVKSFLCHVCLWFIYICLSGFDIFFWHWLCLLLAPQWQILVICTHTHLTALFPGLSRWADTRKVEPIWILLKLETMSDSGISWAICKSAPCSRQTTTLAPLCFLHAGCPSCWPTNSVKALKANSSDHSSYMHVSEMSVAVVVSK